MGFLKSIKEDLNREWNTKPREEVDESLQVTEEVIPEETIDVNIDGHYRIFVKKEIENERISTYNYKEREIYKIEVKPCLNIGILNQNIKLLKTFELSPFSNRMYSGLSYTTLELDAYETLINILNNQEEKSKIVERIKNMAIKEVKTYCKDLNLFKMKEFVKENGKIKINMSFTLTESELED